ncbi:MAG: LptF/LptG family permease, partial [Candidatus Halichondribacter symbioticus]
MPYLDRYILKQLFFPFIFFLLVFAGILWFNRSLSILDFIAKNRQPAVIFLELCAYLLPQAIDLALPISAFAASAFVTNRLLGE